MRTTEQYIKDFLMVESLRQTMEDTQIDLGIAIPINDFYTKNFRAIKKKEEVIGLK